LSALAGPLGWVTRFVTGASVGEAAGNEAEQRLFHLDEIKKALPRDSSALAIIADPQICDRMVELFSSYEPKVVRRDVADELRDRLEGLHRRIAQEIVQGAGAPAAH